MAFMSLIRPKVPMINPDTTTTTTTTYYCYYSYCYIRITSVRMSFRGSGALHIGQRLSRGCRGRAALGLCRNLG